ncbi:Dolichyl pyrophosphate Man9GlcNAc2 alpha-1,3-glucosyltransferase, putative [Candida dubliniensis CD36]|uniref:Alpha-1,3-glucosyltransferase n=1 Tax=Candida dubliniensis (strain CD36 / ATCC MYA-646 / CBS 7987 / NCPF 3949 / NRRL Y-17841) TaxID=573826 RepID=B9WM92_CANDC|nr:Dolichyl pyrophosphate Man9GlcNAc2 alpha-1,3-glucosyltransferase, putative [Candida dubliniensis CD36]CAX40205.1 Dolichyl pyrophosphate Man9GlcNAc2 alpha-1,3-glucosyltransferase, putative [Candida dubliniensis CD36]
MARSKKKQSAPQLSKEPTPVVYSSKKQVGQHLRSTSIFKKSPVYDLLHYFEKAPDQWTARYILILTAVILRAAVGLGGHSGYHTPPMFGDFEAQRHWMELTIHLPISQWYYFDLQYWGLDYPVLTAYHSYICGKLGNFINSSWFALNTSRGLETDDIRTFMRITAIISELIIYIPSILKIANILGKKSNINRMDQIIIALIIINQPHLVLIDHGHFQYNSIMLGFFIYSIIDLIKGNLIMASVWFISCINFKQMGLYYSLFIFFYILSQLNSLSKFFLVGLTVVITQFIYLLPFIWFHPDSILQIVYRVFPFNRGLFEDKVANFWCTTNILIKYREIFTDASQLSKLTLIATLLATIPINLLIFYKIKTSNKPVTRKSAETTTTSSSSSSLPLHITAMIYGFALNALSFYLFSYQVHEKSILIALIPILLLLLINPQQDITMIQFINTVGTFSLYPLLKKDGLIMQYFVLNFLINWLIGFDLIIFNPQRNSNTNKKNLIIWIIYFMMIIYHIIDFTIDPPLKYPDLWVILNTTISFVAFGYFWLWLVYRIIKL